MVIQHKLSQAIWSEQEPWEGVTSHSVDLTISATSLPLLNKRLTETKSVIKLILPGDHGYRSWVKNLLESSQLYSDFYKRKDYLPMSIAEPTPTPISSLASFVTN